MTEKEIYTWFLATTLADLPPVPFELKPAVVVTNAERWHNATRIEVQAAIAVLEQQNTKSFTAPRRTPRQRTGVLQLDLARLRELKPVKS